MKRMKMIKLWMNLKTYKGSQGSHTYINAYIDKIK